MSRLARWNGWIVYLLVCLLFQGVVLSISLACVVHNPEHYNSASVLMAFILTTGAELALAIVGILFEVFE